jgi:hypothetical protein
VQPEPAILEVQQLIQPKLKTLIEYVNEQHELTASIYFTELAIALAQAKTEPDLLGWCIELSRAAFIGIQYDQVSWALVDEILADAELISMTFTASSENPQ